MDSFTQATLGAAVTVAVMHRRVAPWKAAAIGALAGTLPDLDVLVDHGDAITNMLRHRAETHALFWLSIASLPLALLAALATGTRDRWRRWWLALWLALVTHPLLDVFTLYGTRVLLPFSDQPWSIGSVFFVDPLVTLPWLIGIVAAVVTWRRGWAWALRANQIGLALGVIYLGWSLAAQALVATQARQSLAARGIAHDRMLVTPTPFNTLLWRVVAVQGDVLHEGFHSLLDAPGAIEFTAFARGSAWLPALGEHTELQALRGFTQGFYKLQERDGRILASDVRIAQEPEYEFTFLVAQRDGRGPGTLRLVRPTTAVEPSMERIDESLAWLWRRMWGEALLPPR
jgi:inner membrane protein